MTKVYVQLPAMPDYKKVVILDRPGIVYINLCAREDAKMCMVLPDLEGKYASMQTN